jgi:hypothetical protein
MPRKRIDPKRVALLDKQVKLRRDFEKAYIKMRRAIARMERSRKAIIRIDRGLEALDNAASVEA